jgi:hypothetical protein
LLLAKPMQRQWILCVLLCPGCGGQMAGPPTTSSPSDDAGGYGGGFAPVATPIANEEAGLSAPASVAPPVIQDAASPWLGQGSSVPPDAAVAGMDGACTQPLAAGSLTIDELMIESVAGAGDDGEWLEIQSTLDCAIDLRGLHGDCPRGAKVATFDVTDDVWVPPRGTFLVADSRDPAINHDLPGVLVVWANHPGDVLRNKGATVTLTLGDQMIDSLTYPALKLTVGASMAFPSNCDPALRGDFSHWKVSAASWFPGFLGTPNAPNVDVQCP